MAVRFSVAANRLTATTSVPTGTAYTMLCWGKLVVDINNFAIFFAVRNASRTIWVETAADGTTLEMSTAGTTSGAGDISGLRTLALNTWYRFALVINGTSQLLYHGAATGALTASAPTTAPPDQFTPTAIDIGGDANAAFLNGEVAAFKMFNAALTATEVAAELAQFNPVRRTSLLRYHPFFTAPGLNDLSGWTGAANLTAGATATVTSTADPAIPIAAPGTLAQAMLS